MEEILKKLVSFRTVSGDAGTMHELLEYVAGFVAARGMHVAWFEFDGFESIVATVTPGHKTPKVMLGAHADVVPADESMFTLRKESGEYIGRGVLDMKFALAAYLYVIDALGDDLARYDLGLMVTSDEELGGNDGVAKLVDAGYLPKVCILPDGGENWQVQTAANGLLVFDISAQGKAAHGSRPWLGDNAIKKLLFALDEIAALFPKQPAPGDNTISLTRINAGQALNQIPESATMTVDIRSINSAEHFRLYDAVHAICRQNGLVCHDTIAGSPVSVDLSNMYVAPFARIITEVTGIKIVGSHAPGASDARHFVPFGIPCVSLYPTGGNLHADGEWIDAEAFEQFAVVLRQYLDEVAPVDAQPVMR